MRYSRVQSIHRGPVVPARFNTKVISGNDIDKAARNALLHANKIVVKVGSNCLTRGNGAGVALARAANIVEQVCHLRHLGRQVIFVASGAVAAGRQIVHGQCGEPDPDLPLPIPTCAHVIPPHPFVDAVQSDEELGIREFAALGQMSLATLFGNFFETYQKRPAQVLIDTRDLHSKMARECIVRTIDGLLRIPCVIPIVNENDALQMGLLKKMAEDNSDIPIPMEDNDAIAAVLARELEADALLLLSNVEGVYSGDPSQEGTQLLRTITPSSLGDIKFGAKSGMGRGGMESKVRSGMYAVEGGVRVIIGDGTAWRSILKIVEGHMQGTLLTPDVPNPAK
eukprot:TRINITY_DN33355_c0_g1_i1.p1 TRINITY_DN33355_c0_g1~~TRINITY_DN33355_c0_g1_i1.p1  ORF type:complete len:339 (-),score=72.82 TRINITY_DN33355_c0_g1_i1:331-1347(-)